MGKIRKEYNTAFDIVSASKYHPGNYVDFWVGLEFCQKYGMAELEERLIGLQPASEEAALRARQTPKPIEAGDGSLQPNPQKWNNVACSGNTASQILDKEFLDQPEDDGKNGVRPAWGDKPEFVTLTMGGNDVGILNLVSTCILSFKLWGKNCEEVIQEGMDIAQSDELKNNFTAVIERAYMKGRSAPVGIQFQVFVTGYAQFFNQKTTQCNDVSFKSSWNPLTAQLLTVERRTKMNALALALNAAIKSAVDAIDPLNNVHYVDYDSQFEGHRFCDQDEPSPNNPNTWFFNWQTSEDPTTETAFQSLTAYKSSVANQSTGVFQTDADYINALGDALGDDADALSLLSDSVRIFHPTSLGHQKIRDVMESALEQAGVPGPVAASPSSSPSPSPSSTPSSTPPPPYATGTCSFHLTETQDCDSNYGSNLYGKVVMKDNNKAIIGQTVIDDDHPIGYAMDDGNPYSFDSKLPNPLVITGEHKNDYVQFTYGSLSWQSKKPNGGGTCTVGGWDPRDGPVCGLRFGNQNAVNQMDCSFPC